MIFAIGLNRRFSWRSKTNMMLTYGRAYLGQLLIATKRYLRRGSSSLDPHSAGLRTPRFLCPARCASYVLTQHTAPATKVISEEIPDDPKRTERAQNDSPRPLTEHARSSHLPHPAHGGGAAATESKSACQAWASMTPMRSTICRSSSSSNPVELIWTTTSDSVKLNPI